MLLQAEEEQEEEEEEEEAEEVREENMPLLPSVMLLEV